MWRRGLFDGEMAEWIREVRDLDGRDIDKWIERADKFVSKDI